MKYYCENCGGSFDTLEEWEHERCPLCRCTDLCIKAIPVHETVAQWEARKGRKYPDTAPVWVMFKTKDGHVRTGTAKQAGEPYWTLYEWGDTKGWRKYNPIVVATEAGAPPDDWRPEHD